MTIDELLKQSALEQNEAAFDEVAGLLGKFKRAFIRYGFSDATSEMLVLEYLKAYLPN